MAGARAVQPSAVLGGHCLQSSHSAALHRRGGFCGVSLRVGQVVGKNRTWRPLRISAEGSGLSKDQGGRWLSCTTRHVRLFAGELNPETRMLDQADDKLGKLSFILDPDNEFIWPEDKEQAVYAYLTQLVDEYAVSCLPSTPCVVLAPCGWFVCGLTKCS